MNYKEAIKYLYEQLPMFQRLGPVAYKNNLDNTWALDKMFNQPHEKFKTIHVAGTNGKGSVSHMLASVLQAAGYKVGLYTSPHLKDFRERIRVNGEMISELAVCEFSDRFISLNKDIQIEPSFFELTVTMAFNYFSKCEVDVAVIEVGLGGRLDSTNIISPEISVITNISFDHTNLLGKTLKEIAGEKAGIIKSKIPVVIGETQEESKLVFSDRAKLLDAPLIFADQEYCISKFTDSQFEITRKNEVLYRNLKCDLKGEYQHKNLVTSLAALHLLKSIGFQISNDNVYDGLKAVSNNTGIMGRWQQLGASPVIVCDTAHNEAGIAWVVKQLRKQAYRKLHIVFGTVNDKDILRILALLPSEARYYFTKAQIDRAYDETKLKEDALKFNLEGEAYPNVKIALEAARGNATVDDLIFVGGSNFIVAEVV